MLMVPDNGPPGPPSPLPGTQSPQGRHQARRTMTHSGASPGLLLTTHRGPVFPLLRSQLIRLPGDALPSAPTQARHHRVPLNIPAPVWLPEDAFLFVPIPTMGSSRRPEKLGLAGRCPLCYGQNMEAGTRKRTGPWIWWCRPIIPALRRPRQEDLREFRASLDYKERPCLKQTNKHTQISSKLPKREKTGHSNKLM